MKFARNELTAECEDIIADIQDEGNDDLGGIVFKTANLKVEDILTKFNSIILPLVKTESDDERTTKGAKKNVQSDKKKKGGK